MTDRPLSGGVLLLDDGAKIELRDGVARVPMQKDGAYHVSIAEQGDQVRLSDDYFIEVRKAMPPNVRIVRPGRDAKPNPIEEVTITVQADDDFRAARHGLALFSERRTGEDGRAWRNYREKGGGLHDAVPGRS